MKLPNAQVALVEQEKVVQYLLNPAHPDNGGKAAFFGRLGFDPDHWSVFAAALRKLAVTGEVSKTVESPHGTKYVVVGTMDTVSGESPMVRSVWIVDRGSDVPRLVTAYPKEA
jgi:Domain of unknown function (DUF6883)